MTTKKQILTLPVLAALLGLFISFAASEPVYAQTCYGSASEGGGIRTGPCPPHFNEPGTCYFIPPLGVPSGGESVDFIIDCTSAQNGEVKYTGEAPEPPRPKNSPSTPSGPEGGSALSGEAVPLEDNPILTWLEYILNFLAVGVGLVVTVTLIISGIQLMTSQGNPNSIAAARTKITWALISLALYTFAYALSQWLIPGGIFG